MITDRQVALLSQKLMEGKIQETAAAKAGMSVRSARKWQSGALPSETKQERQWRSRSESIEAVVDEWTGDMGDVERNVQGLALRSEL